MDISVMNSWLSLLAGWLGNVFPIIGDGLMVLGCFFIITGAIGLLRFPDFYTRLHPAGVGDSVGAPLVLLGFACQDGVSLISLKIIVLALFFLITSPTACYALAKAALSSGLKPKGTIRKKPANE
jgi:multicomponent Na+:H+ antiporter subunit G